MCTVSWLHDENGYQLFCNRDEKLTRKRALAPRLAVRDGVRFVAPVDGDFGGTWLATNEFGVTVGLLNGANLTGSGGGYPREARSRGLFLLDLISSPSVAVVCDRVRDADLASFAPFTLAVIEPGQPTAVIEWNGSLKTVGFQDEPCYMLTSSSLNSEEVRKKRQEEFGRLATSLLLFHQSHSPARSAYSVCMHRSDAETVSFSRVRVSHAGIDFFYTPAAPCEHVPGVCVELTRGVLNGSSNAANPTRPGRAGEHQAAS